MYEFVSIDSLAKKTISSGVVRKKGIKYIIYFLYYVVVPQYNRI